jgi:hypothetical protein
MNWIMKLLGGEFAGKVGDYFVEKQKLKNQLKLTTLEGKIRLESAKVEAAIAQQKHISSWEQTYVNMQATSIKDEVVLAVVLFPYIGAFVPVIQDYVLVGFQYLEQMPYWAVGLTVTICLAIYGIRHKNAASIQAPGLRDKDVTNETNS